VSFAARLFALLVIGIDIISGPGPLGKSIDKTEIQDNTVLKHVVTVNVTVDAVEVDILNLDLDADKTYIIYCQMVNNGTAADYRLQVNDDTTDTNYHREVLGGSAENNAVIFPTGGDAAFTIVMTTNDADIPIAYSVGSHTGGGSGITPLMEGWTYTGSTTNVTQITIQGGSTDRVGIGSEIVIFRVI